MHNFRFARVSRIPYTVFSARRNHRGFSSKKLENRGRSPVPFYPRVSESRSKWSVSVLVRWPSWWRRRSTNSQWRWTSRSSPRCHLWTQCCSLSSDSSTVDPSSIIRPGMSIFFIFSRISFPFAENILLKLLEKFYPRVYLHLCFFFYSRKITFFAIVLWKGKKLSELFCQLDYRVKREKFSDNNRDTLIYLSFAYCS